MNLVIIKLIIFGFLTQVWAKSCPRGRIEIDSEKIGPKIQSLVENIFLVIRRPSSFATSSARFYGLCIQKNISINEKANNQWWWWWWWILWNILWYLFLILNKLGTIPKRFRMSVLKSSFCIPGNCLKIGENQCFRWNLS